VLTYHEKHIQKRTGRTPHLTLCSKFAKSDNKSTKLAKPTPNIYSDELDNGEKGFLWGFFDGTKWEEDWEVPWGPGRVVGGMAFWAASFVLCGLVIQLGAVGLHIKLYELSAEEQSYYLLLAQSVETVAAIAVVNNVVGKFRPLPANWLKLDIRDPFKAPDGWLGWGLLGYFSSFFVVALTTWLVAQTSINQTEGGGTVDSVVGLVDVGSPVDALCLLVVTSVLAPLAEEYVFRGFLLASLTKWMPAPGAIVLSSAVFSLAHFAPRDIPQLFALGLVLGSVYVRTKNLMSPILVHSFWNSGVLVLLFLLSSQGISIQELVAAE